MILIPIAIVGFVVGLYCISYVDHPLRILVAKWGARTRTIPYVVIELKCPLCGNFLRTLFVPGMGDIHVHDPLSNGFCPNEGKKFTVGPNFKVTER